VFEPSNEDKVKCLRRTFAKGTNTVHKTVYSQVGEDGVIEAAFNCIGHRDKCAQQQFYMILHLSYTSSGRILRQTSALNVWSIVVLFH
jgi:hypothetical protein